MAKYILDSNTITLLKYKKPQIILALRRHGEDEVGVSSVSVDEFLTGWYSKYRKVRTNSQRAIASAGLAEAVMILRRFPIWPDSENSLDAANRMFKAKLNIGKMDIRIATIALELDATVVTNKIRDFSRVLGLKVEDWSV